MKNENFLTETMKVESDKKFEVTYFVCLVFRGNFNDEMYLESAEIDVDDLKDKPLVWFDPYFGRSKKDKTEVAITKVTDDELTLLVRKNGEIIKEEKGLWSYILCEDFDDSCLLASHITRYTKN